MNFSCKDGSWPVFGHIDGLTNPWPGAENVGPVIGNNAVDLPSLDGPGVSLYLLHEDTGHP